MPARLTEHVISAGQGIPDTLPKHGGCDFTVMTDLTPLISSRVMPGLVKVIRWQAQARACLDRRAVIQHQAVGP